VLEISCVLTIDEKVILIVLLLFALATIVGLREIPPSKVINREDSTLLLLSIRRKQCERPLPLDEFLRSTID
jgi:hypothetical protein